MNKNKTQTVNILDNILNQTSKKEADLIRYRMLLASKIDKALKKKAWKKKELAEKTGKSRSTITKWLSGTHNFTSDTLFEIGNILDVSLINFENTKPKEQVIFTRIDVSSEVITDNSYMNSVFYNSNYGNWETINNYN